MDHSPSTEGRAGGRLAGLGREEQVLCLGSRSRLDGNAGERLRAVVSAGIDWERLWSLGHVHEVIPMLARSLPPVAAPWLPAAWAARAGRRRHVTLRSNARLAEALLAILDSLDEAAVPVIPVKGLALTERLYGDLAARPSADIDILVPTHRLSDARDVLRGLGFRQRARPGYKALVHQFHDPAWGRGEGPEHVRVELHWALWADSVDRLGTDGLWDRAVGTTLLGRPILALSLEDTLLHLAIHRSRSALRLRWVMDIAELVRQERDTLDWDSYLDRAGAAGARTSSSMVLSMAADLLGAPVPEHVRSRLAVHPLKRALVERTCGPTAMFRPAATGDLRQQPHWSLRAFEEDGAGRIARSLGRTAARPLREALHDAGIWRVRQRIA
ncbi:MAG: nucleotidyltransferase family protein [Chloroflexota bacterium]